MQGDLDVPLGVAQGVFQEVAEGDGEQGEGGLHLALLVQLQANVQRLPLQQGSEAGQLPANERRHLLGRALHGLLASQQQEGFGEQGHLVGGGADAADGAGCRGGQVIHLAEQGRGSLDHHVGGAQLVAGKAAELLFTGKHGGYLVLARQQRLLYLSQLLPGGIGHEVPLIRGEVGDPLAQPLQRPGDVTHQPDAEGEAPQQQGQADEAGHQMQLGFVRVEVVVRIVVEHQIEQPLTRGVGAYQEVLVLPAQLMLEEAGALVGLEPGGQAARLCPVAGELARAGGGGRHPEAQPVVVIAGCLRLQPVAQAQLLHLVLGHHHQQAQDHQQQQTGPSQRQHQAPAQARQTGGKGRRRVRHGVTSR